jgi:hypothetical protein
MFQVMDPNLGQAYPLSRRLPCRIVHRRDAMSPIREHKLRMLAAYLFNDRPGDAIQRLYKN